MAMTYTQLSNIAERVRQELARNQDQIEASKAAFSQVSASLTNMGTTYSAWASEVNALAVANPGDPAVASLKAHKDRMVAEFNITKTRADALTSAIDGI